jgi:hypothetical protein
MKGAPAGLDLRLQGGGEQSPSAFTRPKERLTDVELIWIEARLQHWIRFGRHVSERIVTRRTRVLSFRPGAVFALVRWTANDFGTIHSRLDIIRAPAHGEPYTSVPFVRPGGEIYLSLTGWPKVREGLTLIDAIEAADVDPCEVSPNHWHHMQSRLLVGERVRPYGKDRHALYLRRKELGL